MVNECEEGTLNWKSPMTLAGLAIDLKELAEPDGVKISCYHDCMGNAETRRININRYTVIDCYDGSNDKWELHYVEYINEYSVKVKVCPFVAEPEPEPPEPVPDDLTDYERIKSGTQGIINAAVTTLSGYVSNVAGSVGDLHDYAIGRFGGLGLGISDLSGAVGGWIGDLQTNLTDQISGVTEALTGGFKGISDKLDAMEFPSLEGVKAAFLDVCADLAIALWDAILDRIEERYPKDEEESD